MSETWIAIAIGAGSGGLLLALFAWALSAKALAQQGYIVLNVMLAIYIGAQLVTGTITDVIYETLFAAVLVIATQLAMRKWLPSIGVAIFLHGLYDAIFGPHTGIADWYPPLCAGFDFVVGIGLIAVLIAKEKRRTI